MCTCIILCFQKVDGLKAKRDRLVNDLREVVEVRRKTPEIQNLLSQSTGLEMRLKHSKRDKEITVSEYCLIGCLAMCRLFYSYCFQS